MLREAKRTHVIIQKSPSWGSSFFDQKVDPIGKNLNTVFEKNMAISLGSPKEFKFSGYEGLIYGTNRTENQNDMFWSRVRKNQPLSHFMLIFDDSVK